MRVTLIHNPGAGRQENDAKALIKLLRRAGHKPRYQSSREEGWDRVLDKRADLVVVAGGDGTVAAVARRMVRRGVPVAVLPSGTANNVARSLGLLNKPFEELVRGWRGARRVPLDVGLASGPWGERYFIEGIGAGLFAGMLVRSEQNKGKKEKDNKSKGPAKVVDSALRRLTELAEVAEPVEIAAQLDGVDISGNYLLFEAVNLPYIGPNLYIAPDTRAGDGKLEVVLVPEAQRNRLVKYLEHWHENRERPSLLPSRRGKHLQIEWTGFALHIDDKLRPKKKADADDVAGLVDVRVDGAAVEFLGAA
ncbi:MAG TPA: diacylglycerol kinase family protein [Burkholderiales bacterium]